MAAAGFRGTATCYDHHVSTVRILLLNANRAGIGTYHRALWFGRELARGGHQVTLMTVSNARRFVSETKPDRHDMSIVECPNLFDEWLPWHASGPLDIWLRTRAILTKRYDLVYAFEYQPNVSLPVYLTRPLRRFKLISDWCDWHAGASYHFGGRRWAHAVDRVFEEHIRHRADHLTVINEVLRERALSIGIPAEKITVVYEGVDPEYIRPFPRTAARTRLGLPTHATIVGTIRDSDAGLELLLHALRLALTQVPNLRLLFIGAAPEALQTLAARHDVAERVIVPGRVSDHDLPYYLASADLLALPLEDNLINRGRWPHKLGDMIAAERPVLVSKGGEFPAMLGERGAARVIAFKAEAYAAAILALIRSPEDGAALAARGRRIVVEELNWARIGAQIRDVILRVAVGRRELSGTALS
jgi:glycosyltransferase involved in cell wall biosynthesis